jgi:menaquinone-dependent protoporphyrinogen oxidase
MNSRILVAYASVTGSTAEIAVEIGKTLSSCGYTVDVFPTGEKPRLEGYQAVLIGSAVNFGNWLPEAVDFVRENQEILSELPVALFCVHIRNLGDDDASRKGRQAYLDEVRPLLQAVDEAYFAGRFDRRGAALLLPKLLARFTPTMERRNWEQIRSWAESVPDVLVSAV